MLTLCVVGVSSLVSLAFEDKDSVPPIPTDPATNISILPEEVPDELSADEFAELPESWREWGTDVAATLSSLYEDESLSDSDRRNLVTKLRGNVATIDSAKSNATSDTGLLRTLRNRLVRRLDVIESAFAALENDDASTHSSPSTINVSRALLDVDNLLNRKTTGEDWKSYLGTAETRAALDNVEDQAARIESLKKLHTSLAAETGDLTAEQADFLSGKTFRRLSRTIEEFITATKAADPSQRKSTLRTELAKLLTAIEDHENGFRSTSADDVQRQYHFLKRTFPGAGHRMGQALRDHYFNYNLHVVIPEALIVPLAGKTQKECGPVDDCILGAKVDGIQHTTANVGLDVKPSSTGFLFRLNVNGHTVSNTTGRKSPAVIYTRGDHYFSAHKDIFFDGNVLSAGPTLMHITPHNKTLGATTKYDWVPLLGGIAKKIAFDEAIKKKRQSEAIAAQRLHSKAQPKLDAEVREQLATANGKIQDGMSRLRNANMYPSSLSARSSESHLALSTRTMRNAQLGGSRVPNNDFLSNDGISMQIHDSLINNALDELDLAGRKIGEDELLPHLESVLTRLLGRSISLRKTKPDAQGPVPADPVLVLPPDKAEEKHEEQAEDEEPPSTFVFDPTDPFRVEFEDGYLNLILRTGIEQEGKEPIPLQEIVVPITFKLSGSNVILEAESPRITSVNPVGPLKQIPRAAQIRRIIEAKLPRRELKTTFDFMIEDHRMDMNLSSIRSNDGWISLYLSARQSRIVKSAIPVIQPYSGQVVQPHGETIIQGSVVPYPVVHPNN